MDEKLFYLLAGVVGFIAAKAFEKVFSNKETLENTVALKGLTVEISYMRAAIEKIPKLINDMDHAHAKIRDIEKELRG